MAQSNAVAVTLRFYAVTLRVCVSFAYHFFICLAWGQASVLLAARMRRRVLCIAACLAKTPQGTSSAVKHAPPPLPQVCVEGLLLPEAVGKVVEIIAEPGAPALTIPELFKAIKPW